MRRADLDDGLPVVRRHGAVWWLLRLKHHPGRWSARETQALSMLRLAKIYFETRRGKSIKGALKKHFGMGVLSRSEFVRAVIDFNFAESRSQMSRLRQAAHFVIHMYESELEGMDDKEKLNWVAAHGGVSGLAWCRQFCRASRKSGGDSSSVPLPAFRGEPAAFRSAEARAQLVKRYRSAVRRGKK